MPSTFANLRMAVQNERSQVERERHGLWYGGQDLATPNDIKRINLKHNVLTAIEAEIRRAEEIEKVI